jgi:Fe-S-cluster containining protein
MKKFPCFECIKVNNGGCCHAIPPVMMEECAKIMFKYNDLIKEKEIQVAFNKDVYHFFPKGSTNLNDLCPFLDFEKGCLIYEDRPQICRDYGE